MNSRATSWEITLDGQGYQLYHAPDKPTSLPGAFISAQPNGPGPGAEAVRLFEDFSGGMGYSRRLIQNGYERAQRADTRYPNIVFAGPQVTEVPLPTLSHAIDVSFEVDWRSGHNDLFLLAGRYALMVGDGRDAPVISQDFGSGLIARSARKHAGGPVYVGIENGYIWRLASSWTQSSDVQRLLLAQAYWTTGGGIAGTTGQGGVGQYTMVGTDASLAGFRWLTATHLGPDPMTNANWAPALPVIVGHGGYPIKRLVETNRAIFFVKTNGVHSVSGDGYSPNLTPYWQEQVDGTWNGSAAVYYNGYIYAAHANYLDRVPVDGRLQQEPQRCGPGQSPHPNESVIWGRCSALAVIDGQLWHSTFNPETNTSYICVGRERQGGEDGYGPLVWHGSLIELPGKVTLMHVSSLYPNGSADDQPRVWIATDETATGGTYHLYWVPLPRGANPLQDSDYRFTRSWSLWTGLDDGGTQNSWTKKITRRVDLYADHVTDSGGTISIALGADGDTETAQGTLGGQARVSFLTDQIEGTMISARIDGVGAETVTPVLRSTALHEIMLPEQTRQRTFQIVIGTSMERQSLLSIQNALESLQLRGDVTMVWQDRTYVVKVMPNITYQEIAPVNPDDPMIYVANVRVDVIRRRWYYDDGTHYDSGEYWG